MRIFVVSLQSRLDRKQLFAKTNQIRYEVYDAVNGLSIDHEELLGMGFDTNKDWIDPINKTHLTHGEVGCFMSHYELWDQCISLNEPIIILEDEAVMTDRYSNEEIETTY